MEKIDLGTFIHQVKRELIEAQRNDEVPFYSLEEVELEMDFIIDTSAEAKGKLFIVDVGGQVSKTKSHRIKLKLKPIGNIINDENASLSSNTEDSELSEKEESSGGRSFGMTGSKFVKVVYESDKIH